MLKSRYADDSRVEVGIDEAGRGCLWGPLVASAVVWPRESDWTAEIRELSTQVKDSKKVTAKRRAVLEKQIQKTALGWGIGVVTPTEIDEHGMSWANRTAFQRAVVAVGEAAGPPAQRRLLIDGVLGLRVSEAGEGVEQIVEPGGDGTYLAVAAASILAKEGRDRMVIEACSENQLLEERYGLLRSKGYGTAAHRAAIQTWGLDTAHRRLFLRKLLGEAIYAGKVSAAVADAYEFLEDTTS